MKKFFTLVLANILALVIVVFVGTLLLIGSIASSFSSQPPAVKSQSILDLNLGQAIPDRASSNSMDNFTDMIKGQTSPLGLNKILESIERAAEDPNIIGIHVNAQDMSAGMSTVYEIRKALQAFKASGKFVYAYADYYTQNAYYLSSVADSVFMNPVGLLMFQGLSTQVLFLKGALDKLGVEMQVVRHGKFKGAVEPFTGKSMSPENKAQTLQYLQGIWNTQLEGIAEARKLSVDELQRIADHQLAERAPAVIQLKMIDRTLTQGEYIDLLMNKAQVSEEKKLRRVDVRQYAMQLTEVSEKSEGKIAVIYAQGEVVMNSGGTYSIGTENISKALRRVADDKKIKAIVLRVNSPGGSALTSDIIYEEVERAKAKKPVVASFGNYAASGGYYIACGANKILAEPTTITGSIGVFGMVPNAQKLATEKLGLAIDGVGTNAHSLGASIFTPLSDFEKMRVQAQIEEVYDRFISCVSKGRGLDKAYVDSIGQGRVWSGVDAKKLGLIDDFGGLEEAIALAAQMVGLADYKVVNYPKEKDLFSQINESFSGLSTREMRKEMGVWYEIYDFVKSSSEKDPIQARMPFQMVIE